jgi:hypothetical protein
MNIDVKNLSMKGNGKLSWRKLRREAMKTRITPGIHNIGTAVNYTKERFSNVGNLSFDYATTVGIMEAYANARRYDALANDLGNRVKWDSPTVKVDSQSNYNLGNGEWKIEQVELAIAKPKISVRVMGEIEKGVLLDGFDGMVASRGYRDNGIRYKGKPVLFYPFYYLEASVEEITPEIVAGKIKKAQVFQKPYFTLEHISSGKESRGLIEVGPNVFVKENQPSKVEFFQVTVPLGEFGWTCFNGIDLHAVYSEFF